MEITKISYSRVYSLGNYENEKIGMEATLGEGDDILKSYVELKNAVEHAHDLRKDLRKRDAAEAVLRNPDGHRGYDVKEAEAFMQLFKEKYPNLIYEPNLLLEEKKSEDYADEYHEQGYEI